MDALPIEAVDLRIPMFVAYGLPDLFEGVDVQLPLTALRGAGERHKEDEQAARHALRIAYGAVMRREASSGRRSGWRDRTRAAVPLRRGPKSPQSRSARGRTR